MYYLSNKVAIVTGAASGIGYACAKELLKNNVKGVVILDIKKLEGEKAAEDLRRIFGRGKVIFIQADVSIETQFEHAFKETILTFGYVDILINNAACIDEQNWKKCIQVNCHGIIIGARLAIEYYLQKYRSCSEAVILNISSVAAFDEHPIVPVYAATKAAILGFTLSYGARIHYTHTGVRTIAICPGYTQTNFADDIINKSIRSHYFMDLVKSMSDVTNQRVEHVSKEILDILRYASTGTIWIIEDEQPAYEYNVKAGKNKNKIILLSKY